MSNGPTPAPAEGSDAPRVSAGANTLESTEDPGARRSAAEGLDSEGRPRPLARGTVVGRHVVLDQLGVGGMGVVYVAYDPELDRKIALKLLRPGGASPIGRARLLREAQALAKLSHPHVVAIHDVGTVDDQVWLAMEFVQGQTLGRWLKTPRGWQAVVQVMRDAGEGLAAAHSAGLLHRDFKPDNVMVGDDGRVRVMDFGLARVTARVTLDPLEDSTDVSGSDRGEVQVSKTGTIVGTPAYMAPEQFAMEELTPAADQFAFCVLAAPVPRPPNDPAVPRLNGRKDRVPRPPRCPPVTPPRPPRPPLAWRRLEAAR